MTNANYQYWQENGSGWFEEYERRKQLTPYFHIQEVLIAELVASVAPAKVLDYGCGVGRHLRNLCKLPGVEAYGFDQSPTMAANIAKWATPDFISDRVRIGAPCGKLPYEDGEFDAVFTSEVLVHTRPEDVAGVLAELLRISKGFVFHLEPDPTIELIEECHGGCWAHDLVTIYRQLGEEPRVLTRAFACQLPVLVERKDESTRRIARPVSEATSKILAGMEQSLTRVIEPVLADGFLDIDWNKRIDGPLNTIKVREDEVRTLSRSQLLALTSRTLNELERLRRQVQHNEDFGRYLVKRGFNLAIHAHEAGWGLESLARYFRQSMKLEVLNNNPAAKGNEVWLRFLRLSGDSPAVPWSFLQLPEGWSRVDAPGCTNDVALLGTSGVLVLPGGDAPTLNFMRHPYSGRVRITWKGREIVVDLYQEETSELTLDLEKDAAEEGIR